MFLGNEKPIILTFLAASLFIFDAKAQVVTDGSLGPEVRLNGNDIQIGSELGTSAGTNLFHSFAEFGVVSEGRVTFNGASDTANVIARVTGGNVSDIDGTIASTMPLADLWLINPAGIVFGQNARLDVPGSFHASTAGVMELGEDGRFFASLGEASQLSVAEPSAFGFLDAGRGDIRLQGANLQLEVGTSLSLSAANISLDGSALGGVGATLVASAVDGAGRLEFELGTLDAERRGSLLIQNESAFGDEATFRVSLEAGETVIDRSQVFAGNSKVLDESGGVTINSDVIRVDNGSQIVVGNFSDTAGGSLEFDADEIFVGRGVQIFNTSLAEGASGSINVNASQLELRGGFIQNIAAEQSAGGAGVLSVVVDDLIMSDDGSLGSITLGAGDAGIVAIEADRIEIGAASLITSGTVGSGNGSIVIIDAGQIVIDRIDPTADNSAIVTNSTAEATGNAGSILINAEAITLRNGAELSSSTRGSGSAGVLLIQSGSLTIDNGGLVASITTGDGPSAGMILTIDRLVIDAGNSPDVVGLSTQSSPTSTQDAGALLLTAKTIEMAGGASIESSSFGTGDAGAVIIQAEDISVQNSIIGSISTGVGDAGLIQIMTGGLSITSDGQDARSLVTTQAAPGSSGRGGAVLIEAETIELSGTEAGIESASFTSLPAGGIAIVADSVIMQQNSGIASNGFAAGPAGDIAIETRNLDIQESSITTEGQGAQGGRIAVESTGQVYVRNGGIVSSGIVPADQASLIRIDAPRIILDNSSVLSLTGDTLTPAIAADASFGEARLIGDLTVISIDSEVAASTTIDIQGVDSELGNNLALPETALVDTSSLIQSGCAQGAGSAPSSFRQLGDASSGKAPDQALSLASDALQQASQPCPDAR